MARISIRRGGRQTRVRVSGSLSAADMGRLERACAGALTRQPLSLVIDLRLVTKLDATASAVLARLDARGATIWHAANADAAR